MNIKQAKQYIKDTVKLYLKKDEYGDYLVPVVRQRPVFMLGAPGVGKTAIMEQIASELGIALVSYSMTHHTRQSALGLPFIVHKTYAGQEYDVSEYTMSEIIASVYETMEKSGVTEGILFLDEINCVSETLAPSMLQFLQYKIFGRHSVPDGWVIVTAGNPPEYNKSVREFDVVTYDRLKLLEVEAEYSAWREYALERRLHGAVVNYLEINKDDFYVIDTTVRGRGYVTARGWEDLSSMITLYEADGLTVDENLVGQYLRNDRIVREFTAYYDLYLRYVSDYHVSDIIDGNITEQSLDKARMAAFDERLSLVGIFIDRILGEIKTVMEESAYISALFPMLKSIKDNDTDTVLMLNKLLEARTRLISTQTESGAYSDSKKRLDKAVIKFLTTAKNNILDANPGNKDLEFGIIRDLFNLYKGNLKKDVDSVSLKLDNIFSFVSQAWGEGNELVLLLTELTVNSDSTSFISIFGHATYSDISKRLMVDDPTSNLINRIEALDL